MRRLKEIVGVDRRTVARAAFMPPVDEDRLPAVLLERFAGDATERMLALLRFLAPLTGGQVQVP